MKTNVSPITESDYEDLLTLFQDFALFEKVPARMLNSVEKMREDKEFFKGFTVKDEVDCILGYVTYFFAYYTWYGKSLYMDDLYVRPEFRGKGLGTLLIKTVIDFAKENKCRKLRWQVSNWNHPAIDFYKSLGAEIDDVESNCDLIFFLIKPDEKDS